MSFRILTLEEKEEWSKLLEKLPPDQQDIYYTPEYYELYEKNCDGKSMCFVYENNHDIALYPFLINSVNNLGYELDQEYFDIQGVYGYNGVVSSSYNYSFRKEFYKTFYEYCSEQNIIAEFVRYNPIIGNHLFGENFLDLQKNRNTVGLNLEQSYDNIFRNQFSSKNRNMINKGGKTLYIKCGASIEDYKIFKPMYQYTMKRLHADKFYHFSNQFFNNISKILSNYCFVFVAYDIQTNTPFGSLLLLIYKNKAHYFLSARSHFCNNNSINNYLLDNAITFAKKKNCSILHLGGGNSMDENDSLLKFKKNFSTNIFDFYISKKVICPSVYNSVCEIWEKRNPSKRQKFQKYLLKYYE